MMDVDCGIYDDLPNNEELLIKEVSKLQAQIKELEAHIKGLEADIEKLCANVVEMKKIRDTLEKNISELYKTAKAELGRKDRIISELRNQLDQYTQQKRSTFSSVKRSRDASSDLHEIGYDSDPKRIKRTLDDSKGRSKHSSSPTRRNKSRSKSRERYFYKTLHSPSPTRRNNSRSKSKERYFSKTLHSRSPTERNKSRSKSREQYKSVYREKSGDNSKREPKTTFYEKGQGKNKIEKNSHFYRDNFQKSKICRNKDDYSVNPTPKQRDSKHKTVDNRTEDKNMKQIEEIQLDKVPSVLINDNVNEKVNHDDVTGKNEDNSKKSVTKEEVINETEKNKFEDVMMENVNTKNVGNEIKVSDKKEETHQKPITHKVANGNVESTTEKSKALKSKYSTLPVSIQVPNLCNIKHINLETSTTTLCKAENAKETVGETKGNDELINLEKRRKEIEIKLYNINSIKKVRKSTLTVASAGNVDKIKCIKKKLGTEKKSVETAATNEKESKAKRDTLRIEDVTKKLQRRLVENNKNLQDNTPLSSVEVLSDQKESLPNKEKEPVDNLKDPPNVNENIFDEENVDKSKNKEVEGAFEVKVDSESIQEKVHAGHFDKQQKQDLKTVEVGKKSTESKGSILDNEKADKKEVEPVCKPKTVQEKSDIDQLRQQLNKVEKNHEKDTKLGNVQKLQTNKTIIKSIENVNEKSENVHKSQLTAEVMMKNTGESDTLNKKELNSDAQNQMKDTCVNEKNEVEILQPQLTAEVMMKNTSESDTLIQKELNSDAQNQMKDTCVNEKNEMEIFQSELTAEVMMKNTSESDILNKKELNSDPQNQMKNTCVNEKNEVEINNKKCVTNYLKGLLSKNTTREKSEVCSERRNDELKGSGSAGSKDSEDTKQHVKVGKEKNAVVNIEKRDLKMNAHCINREQTRDKTEIKNDINEVANNSISKCDKTDLSMKNTFTEVPKQSLEIPKNYTGVETASKSDKKDPKGTESKVKKIKDSTLKKEQKEKHNTSNKKDKHEDEIPESDRVLRSATRRNTHKEKLEKSNNAVTENEGKEKITTDNTCDDSKKQVSGLTDLCDYSSDLSTISLTHEGEIPTLHLPDSSNHAPNDSLFEMNLSIENCSSPLNKSYIHSIDKSSNKTCHSNSLKNESVINTSSESKISNTSSGRKRRRVIVTMID